MTPPTEDDDLPPLTDEEWIAYAEGCGFDPGIGTQPTEGDDS